MVPDALPVAIVDAHSDLLMELVHAERELGERNPFRSRWLAPLRRGGVALQVCALYVDPGVPDALREVLRQARAFHSAVEANADAVFAIESEADLDLVGSDRIGLMLSLEGASCLGSEPESIEALARLGVRMASLTWNERNAFAGGCDHADGLTAPGAELVERMTRLGIVVDLAHASAQTVEDVLELIADPPVVSHAACHALYDHPRNLSDDQLRAVAEVGGVLGLMPHPLVVDPSRPTLDRFLAHVDHAIATMGPEHVGLGGDFLRQIARALGQADEVYEGIRADAALEGLDGPHEYPNLVEALERRGMDERVRSALLDGNFVRVLRQVLP